MERSYRNRLLRQAVDDPTRLTRYRRFRRTDFWPHYLRRCDDVVFDDPHAGLELSKQAPLLAAMIVEASPGVNGADFMLLAYSYLGSAYRRVGDYKGAEESFQEAKTQTRSASSIALAEYLRRLAYLRLFQQNPECFPIIGEAIDIHKRGNLVDRHALGECLICRARAYVMFDRHGESFDDYSAALNHVSIKHDPKPYYCALHCLTAWSLLYGTEEQLKIASQNLKAALSLLGSWWGSPYAKIKLRWLKAVIDMRLGAWGIAEEVLLEVRKGFIDLKLGYELGALSVDLGRLNLRSRQPEKLHSLLKFTVDAFDSFEVDDNALEVLREWNQLSIAEMTGQRLNGLREQFLSYAQPIPSIAA